MGVYLYMYGYLYVYTYMYIYENIIPQHHPDNWRAWLTFDNVHASYGLRHARPAVKESFSRWVSKRLHPRDYIFQILPDFVGGLKAEKVQVSEKVIMHGQKLHVEFR